jgi:hypothetical protein
MGKAAGIRPPRKPGSHARSFGVPGSLLSRIAVDAQVAIRVSIWRR